MDRIFGHDDGECLTATRTGARIRKIEHRLASPASRQKPLTASLFADEGATRRSRIDRRAGRDPDFLSGPPTGAL